MDEKLAFKIDEVRGRERPIPSFSEMISRLAWRSLAGYQTPRIYFERLPLIEIEKAPSKFCDSCGSRLEDVQARYCDRCGGEIIILTR
jgi:hypothetical protein